MKTISVAIFAAVLTFAIALPTFGTLQSAGVTGRLLCQGKPYFNAKVKLYDIDTLDVDDLMAEGRSDKNGEFRLVGNETEFTTIDPKLNIYHNCELT
uniref:Transthyretin-like family protein n=1 Tax=Panagrolaimus superbus TaxID=310955 RepID=A0A914Z0R5_9BILA